jgi:hypothetical protein
MSYLVVLGDFNSYLKDNQCEGEVYLCRTFKRNFLILSHWGDYLTHPRWELPYREEEREKGAE